MKLFIKSLAITATLTSSCIAGVNTFDADCAPENRLKTITVRYTDFNAESKIGTIKTLDTLAPYLENIFNDLNQAKFPIYLADSVNFESDNNTVSYNCRPTREGSSPSMHAYGAAIDINPRENPYISFSDVDDHGNRSIKEIIPADGWSYITRSRYREGKPEHKGMNESIVDIFKDNGILRWGGDWTYPIDYMHFEIPRDVTILLLTMSSEEASIYFKKYVSFYNNCKSKYPEEYSQRNFSDLNKAISIEENQSPIDIYNNFGFKSLISSADSISTATSKKLCLSTVK